MKTFFIILITLLAMIGIRAEAATAQKTSLDHIVAVINHSVIVQSELNAEMNKTKKQLLAANTSLPPPEVLRKKVLDQLINKKLQLELAELGGVKVTSNDIDNAIRSIAKNNHLSVEELYQELAKRGINRKDYREDIHDEYIIQQVQQQAVGPKISISEQEVDDFMRSAAWLANNNKEYHLEDILIALPDAPTSENVVQAEKKAAAIAKKLRQGSSFRELAMAESGGTKALQGGDLGWRKLPEIPSAFASQILQAKTDDIVGPIQAANGFHIIRVAGIRNTTTKVKTEDQRKQVQRLLFERKYEEALQSWLTKIRAEAFITTSL